MANQLTVKHYPGSPRWPSNVEEEVGGGFLCGSEDRGRGHEPREVGGFRSWNGWSPREEGSPAHTLLLAQ